MKNQSSLKIIGLLFVISSCNKEPYGPKAYNAKGIVIGVEKCSVDDNYNFWLIDLSIENNSPEKGDTITYKGVVYNHVFKAINLDSSIKHAGKKIDIKFNFSTNDHQKIQYTDCDAPDAETFSLIDIIPFEQSEIL